ncbi:hypothetical protein SCLCIDRAFT_1217223 [Scleroderma citrinum Foug A]|uniref:Uncharacterized protein n=1 Tax=Scleroderma citrinum Foug A TaxID=1036808 RepID=A0A0C3A5H6_9AGAM|nr:hypothetical protein SCLCIDRAFT_1217223 [Scleroderma citrinum Foug A]
MKNALCWLKISGRLAEGCKIGAEPLRESPRSSRNTFPITWINSTLRGILVNVDVHAGSSIMRLEPVEHIPNIALSESSLYTSNPTTTGMTSPGNHLRFPVLRGDARFEFMRLSYR